MTAFFSGCVTLFNDTFFAVCALDYFSFLAGFVLVMLFFGFFRMLYHGSRKL